MRTKKIKYLIDYYGVDSIEVSGYALDWPVVRLCIRKTHRGWKCDHYDSGFYIGEIHKTMKECIRESIKLIEHNIQNGKYARAIRRLNAKQLVRDKP